MTQVIVERVDERQPDAIIEDVRRFLGISLSSGRSLGSDFPKHVAVNVRSPAHPTDFFWTGPMVVCSARFKEVVERVGGTAEWFPLDMNWIGGHLSSQFYCFNLLEACECLDKTRSQFVPEREFATRITVLSLLPQTNESPIYWISRAIPPILCVRDDVGVAIREAACTGLTMVAPDKWTNPMHI